MANLITALAVSGCRKSDGTPCASGFVFLYQPGTTIPVLGYRDDALTQTWPTTNGGIQLDAGGRAAIWVGQRVDVVVTDASGTQVEALLGFNGTTANAVEVQNPGYTGAITDPATGAVSQGAGGMTDLNTVLSSLAASAGGLDGQFQESPGATPQKLQIVIRQLRVTPQDFGAVGNGKVDDTAAWVKAITELGRLGSGTLLVPPGTYAVSSMIQVGLNSANAQGISIIGAGSGSSVLLCTNAAAGLLLYATRARLQGLSLTTNVGSDVNATYLSIQNAVNVLVEDVVTDGNYRNACAVVSSQEVMLRSNRFVAAASDALAIGLQVNTCTGVRAIGNFIQGGSSGIGLYSLGGSATGSHLFDGNTFGTCGLAGVAFQGDVVGSTTLTGVSLLNSPSLAALSVPILPATTVYQGNGVLYPKNFYQFGNGIDGLTADVTSGGTVQPVYAKGKYFRFRGTTTGSAYIVSAPDVTAANVPRGTEITLEFVNAAGGAVTGWTLDAIYKTTASIPTTDGHSIQVKFAADPNGSGFGGNWREIARADTTT